ncbi:DMT family transporter [Sulfuriflexus mobilis]|uniref:DMT family transporter n=1 Tax=Sulfuriflexus mobilis TaxID=1811807 RepID=UPI000F81A79D|nr:DMT family transporter [Sulfuriflexus mobilis]
MSVPAAYLAIIVIWSTTPLAIKWSGEGPGFIVGVSARMLIGAVLCLLLIRLLRIELPWHKQARQAYLAGAMAVYGAMMCVYWGSQYISSGLLSVIFGLTPLMTGIIVVVLGTERRPGPLRILGFSCALAGLLSIFGLHETHGEAVVLGIAGVLASVFLHSLSAVWLKHAAQGMSAMALTTGSLLVSLPLYLLTWLVMGAELPSDLPMRAGAAIVYLGVVGSVLGYAMYFYALRHVSASKMALVTLITPVTALTLGQLLNNERIETNIWMGAAMIILGLSLHEWGDRLRLKST